MASMSRKQFQTILNGAGIHQTLKARKDGSFELWDSYFYHHREADERLTRQLQELFPQAEISLSDHYANWPRTSYMVWTIRFPQDDPEPELGEDTPKESVKKMSDSKRSEAAKKAAETRRRNQEAQARAEEPVEEPTAEQVEATMGCPICGHPAGGHTETCPTEGAVHQRALAENAPAPEPVPAPEPAAEPKQPKQPKPGWKVVRSNVSWLLIKRGGLTEATKSAAGWVIRLLDGTMIVEWATNEPAEVAGKLELCKQALETEFDVLATSDGSALVISQRNAQAVS